MSNPIEIPDYPELNVLAKQIANETITKINKLPVYKIESKMPYRRQYILEEVIRILNESV